MSTANLSRDPQSSFVSVLLLSGLGLGGAGFFSQHYRIELVPKGQTSGWVAPAATRTARLPPEELDQADVILLDGCEADESDLLAEDTPQVLPRRMNAGRAAKKVLPPCEEEVLADISKSGSALPSDVMSDVVAAGPLTVPESIPAVVSQPGPAASNAVDPALPRLAAVAVLGSLGGGITSMPAQDPPLVAVVPTTPTTPVSPNTPTTPPVTLLPETPTPNTPPIVVVVPENPTIPTTPTTPTTPVSVPEPGSLALLSAALLGLALVRRRRRQAAR